jgi:hypothetical protein
LTVQIEPNQCSSKVPACVGATVPGPDHPTAYFAITCRGGGDSGANVERYYVGPDMYHFSPADDPDNVRSWSCGGNSSSSSDTAEPTWKLLGYFPEDSNCPTALATAKFAGYDCPSNSASATTSLRVPAATSNGVTMDHSLASFIRVVTRVMTSLSSSPSNNNNEKSSSSSGESLRAIHSAESSSPTAGDPVVVATNSSSGGRGWSGTILLSWATVFLVCFGQNID